MRVLENGIRYTDSSLKGQLFLYTQLELAELNRQSSEMIEIDGVKKSRYAWTQEQRRIETAVRYQKDRANLARHSGHDDIRRDAQSKINALNNAYDRITEKAGLSLNRDRMYVAGFRRVKTAEELKKPAKSGIIITDKQLGKKAGRHMAEWNLNPASSEDRQKFIDITKDIYQNADEVRRVPWAFDKNGNRTVEVNAYIKGNDVALVDDNHTYITTMKDGIHNKRVKGGKRIES